MAYEIAQTRVVSTCTLYFDAGHKVCAPGHVCGNLHGHRWRIDVTARGLDNDPLGRDVNFALVADRLSAWLTQHWDHTFIVGTHDPHAQLLMGLANTKQVWRAPFDPTAEHLANYLLREVCPQMFAALPLIITEVVMRETPTRRATVSVNHEDIDRQLYEMKSQADEQLRLQNERETI